MWWLFVHGKSLRVEDTTYFGLASSLTAHSRIAGGWRYTTSRPPSGSKGTSPIREVLTLRLLMPRVSRKHLHFVGANQARAGRGLDAIVRAH